MLKITAGMEKMFYTRPTTSDYLGGIGSGIFFSLHALLLCHDLARMLRCLRNRIAVDDEQLALGLTRSVRPKGNCLGQQRTAVHCKESCWNSQYFGTKFPRSKSAAIPDRELVERIDDDLRGILATHRPEPLPEPLHKEIRGILERFEGA